MKTMIGGDKRRINLSNMNLSQEHFKITYNKKAKNSYVKITYSIVLQVIIAEVLQ